MRDPSDFIDPDRLRQQYGDSDRFRVRVETHKSYSDSKVSFLDWTIDLLEVKTGHQVADIGCGPGNYFGLLVKRGARVVGADLSHGMAKEARARGCPTIVADAQKLPFGDASFDRVMCNHVLYHVPDQRLAMLELRRIARPGGQVLLATNGADHFKEFRDIATLAAADLHYQLPSRPPSPFTLEDGARVRDVFRDATLHRTRSDLVFPTPEPALDYLRSWIGVTGPLENAMRRRMAETIEQAGAFRVRTVAGCFVAAV